METPKQLGRVGIIGRFRPLHNGSASLLDSLCSKADKVIIGIGSSNRYNFRNPFTAEETIEMIDKYLADKYENYEIILLPDFAHIPEYRDGKKWKSNVIDKFGKLDYFVTGNPYVAELLKGNFKILDPEQINPKLCTCRVHGKEVRLKMVDFDDWQSLVPPKVADYLERNDLVERMRKRFGLITIGMLQERSDLRNFESLEEERQNVFGK